MAARSGAGTGVIVGLVVFVLSTVFLLVLTIIFYSQAEDARAAELDAKTALSKYVSNTESANTAVKAVLSAAGQKSQSGVGYLLDQKRNIMTTVTGNPDAEPEDLARLLSRFSGGNDRATFASTMDRLAGDLAAAEAQRDDLQRQLGEMQSRVAAHADELAKAEAARKQEIQENRELIQNFINDVQNYAVSVDDAKRRFLELVSELQNKFDGEVSQLESTVDTLRADLATAQQAVAEYQSIMAQNRRLGDSPEKLVDGRVLDNATTAGEVFINRGRRDKVSLGMTFEVYDDASQLRMQGDQLVRGKASLEVIQVNDSTATCKVTRGYAGRPVVRGDVIANAVYDPNKVFKFMVHGRFDVNGDGRSSEAEADLVRSLVTNWGGEVVDGDEIRGDLDFLLLGEQPVRPGPLPPNPNPIEVEAWVKQNEAFSKYNQLMQDAMRAYIPVLNQNRFFILIGHSN